MKEEIRKFRKALDRIDWSDMPIQFREFPRGCCGDVSDMLAEHLYSLGFKKIDYVCGVSEGASHAWLEIDGSAIDITADQFEDVSENVLFQSPDILHSKYEIEKRRMAGYKQYHGPAIADIMRVHNAVAKILNA